MSSWSYRSRVEYSVLGPLRVSNRHGPIEVRGAKEQTLLAHLVAARGRMVPATALIDTLWGDNPPRSSAKSLQTFVLRLRNRLEPERHGSPSLLVTDGPGYRLVLDPDDIDAERFTRLVALGRGAREDGRADAAVATLAEALALWRGPAFAGFEHTRFGRAEGRRLEELRLGAAEDKCAAELDVGHTTAVIPDVERLLGEHPLSERLWALLMLAHYRAGRQGDALGAYERARVVLADELGVDPGPELRAMHAKVLTQDPGLALEPRRVPVPRQLRLSGGRLVGRAGERDRLETAWRSAVRGDPAIVVLRGPSGAGAMTLAAALAEAVARSGALVLHQGAGDLTSMPVAKELLTQPVLLVADHVEPTVDATLTLILASEHAPIPQGAVAIDLRPLGMDEVREIVNDYVERRDLDAATTEVMVESEGWPGRVHEAAIRCARVAAARRVETALLDTDASSASLASARAELAEGVAALNKWGATDVIGDPDVCPWRGLAAYDVADAPWFAGRERLVAELVARLAGVRLLGVVGASGSGKSSVIRAGLMAALADDVLPGSGGWRQILMRPGAHPMRELASQALGPTGPEIGDLLSHLIRSVDSGKTARTVLVVDQLEEVWTACQDEGERAAFLDSLAALAQDRSEVLVVVAIRVDYLGDLAEHAALAALIADSTVLVGSPTEPEVRRAVERPAERAGLVLDDGLADTLVTDAGTEPGLLPLLSTTLAQLWARSPGRSLTFAAYVAMGGLNGAIATLADEAYTSLTAKQQATARMILLRLTGPGDGATVTRRRVPLPELMALPGGDVRVVVEALTGARLLTTSDGHVEVAHEALFREWPRLRGWVVEDTAGRAVQRRLAVAASEWDAEGRDASALWSGTRLGSGLEVADARPDEITSTELEFLHAGRAALEADQRAAEQRAASTARQNRRLRWLLGGLAAVLVTAIVAGLLAVQSRREAEVATVAADAKRLAASALNIDYPDLALLAAVESTKAEHSPETYGALLTLLARQPAVFHRIRTKERFLREAVSPDGRTIFLSENGPRILAVDALTGRILWDVMSPDGGQVGSFSVTPDGTGLIVTLDSDSPAVCASRRTHRHAGVAAGARPTDDVGSRRRSAHGSRGAQG